MNPKATQYANSKVPNPDRNDAPYYTSRDRWQDVYEAYEAGEKGNWVSVQDGLPDFGNYLVCLENKVVMEMSFSNAGRNRWLKVAIGEESKNNKVTHWMPLPKPPID